MTAVSDAPPLSRRTNRSAGSLLVPLRSGDLNPSETCRRIGDIRALCQTTVVEAKNPDGTLFAFQDEVPEKSTAKTYK